LIGRTMDRFGPRAVMELGVALMGGGLLLAPLTTQPWHLYLTVGVMVGAGSVCLGYSQGKNRGGPAAPGAGRCQRALCPSRMME
jgi:MFS family permease